MAGNSSNLNKRSSVEGKELLDPVNGEVTGIEWELDGKHITEAALEDTLWASEVVDLRNKVMLSSKSLSRVDLANIYDALWDEYTAKTLYSADARSAKIFSLEDSKDYLFELKTRLRDKFSTTKFLMRDEMSDEQIQHEMRRRYPEDWMENAHKSRDELLNILTEVDAGWD